MAVLLVVDDEQLILNVLTKVLGVQQYEVVVAKDGLEALAMLQQRPVDLLLADVNMRPMDGLELLKQSRALRPKLPVVLMTAFGTVSTAISAMTLGAFDYVTKPIRIDELIDVIENALSAVQSSADEKDIALPSPVSYQHGTIIAESPEMKRVCKDIEVAAITPAPSLLCGEIGTGKSLIAQAIHTCSSRTNGDLVVLNCAEMPEPVIERRLFGNSAGGESASTKTPSGDDNQQDDNKCTILLDEITMMPPTLLEKLVLHLAKGVDETTSDGPSSRAGLILSSDATLESLSKMGGFPSLLAQISGVTIVLKPLRERNQDILPLLSHFIYQQTGDWNKLPVLASDVQALLMEYTWPGNQTELADFAHDIFPLVKDGRITKNMLPAHIATLADKSAKPSDTIVRRIDHRGRLLKKFLQGRLPKKTD